MQSPSWHHGAAGTSSALALGAGSQRSPGWVRPPGGCCCTQSTQELRGERDSSCEEELANPAFEKPPEFLSARLSSPQIFIHWHREGGRGAGFGGTFRCVIMAWKGLGKKIKPAAGCGHVCAYGCVWRAKRNPRAISKHKPTAAVTCQVVLLHNAEQNTGLYLSSASSAATSRVFTPTTAGRGGESSNTRDPGAKSGARGAGLQPRGSQKSDHHREVL